MLEGSEIDLSCASSERGSRGQESKPRDSGKARENGRCRVRFARGGAFLIMDDSFTVDELFRLLKGNRERLAFSRLYRQKKTWGDRQTYNLKLFSEVGDWYRPTGKPRLDRSVERALDLLEPLYPSPPYEMRSEGPVLYLDAEDALGVVQQSFMVPDLSFFLNGVLVCVVEIGQLSRPDKLFLWEKYLPAVRVIWIPKVGRYSLQSLINQSSMSQLARKGGMKVSVESLQRFMIPNCFVEDLRAGEKVKHAAGCDISGD